MKRFKDLVYQYLEFTLQDIKDKYIEVTDSIAGPFVYINVTFTKNEVFEVHAIQYCMNYTNDTNIFDSELLNISNNIMEVIEYERTRKVL